MLRNFRPDLQNKFRKQNDSLLPSATPQLASLSLRRLYPFPPTIPKLVRDPSESFDFVIPFTRFQLNKPLLRFVFQHLSFSPRVRLFFGLSVSASLAASIISLLT